MAKYPDNYFPLAIRPAVWDGHGNKALTLNDLNEGWDTAIPSKNILKSLKSKNQIVGVVITFWNISEVQSVFDLG